MAGSMSLSLTGPITDKADVDAVYSSSAPDMAVVCSVEKEESGFPLLQGIPLVDRPASVIVVGGSDSDAVTAFGLQATDFILWPAPASRLGEALVRGRQHVLELALLRTADEMQRLLGEITSSGAELGSAIAARLSAASSTVLSDRDGRGAGDRRLAAAGERTRGRGARSNGTLIATAPLRHSTQRAADQQGVAAHERSDDSVLDLSGETTGDSARRPLRVLVREGRRTRFVPLGDVDWFEADGNYIRVHTGSENYRTRGTIAAIEASLDPRQFVRIHRRIVVNMDRVREMTPLPGGDAMLMLGDGSTLRLSRTYRTRVR